MKIRIVVLLSVFLLLAPRIATAKILDQVGINVFVNIAGIQELEVIEPVEVSFTYPWTGVEEGKALVVNDLGKIIVRSNAVWLLNIDAIDNSGFIIYTRPNGQAIVPWQIVNETSFFSDDKGKYDLSWDIMIMPKQTIDESEYTIRFMFTLSQE